jgi:urease accessory protein
MNAIPEPRKATGLLPLFAWLSPSFPIGAFAYSQGLERAVADGDVRDMPTALSWVGELMRHGSISADIILASCAARAVSLGDKGRFAEVAVGATVEMAERKGAWISPSP